MIRIEPTEFTVCGLAPDHPEAYIWSITIQRRDANSWAVVHAGHCLNYAGEWDYEPIPSERTVDFLISHRFSLERAKELAVAAYPEVVVNGYHVEDGKLVTP